MEGEKRAGQRRLVPLEGLGNISVCGISWLREPWTEQAGILEARQLPLGAEASLFPPCKTDTPAPPAERVGVFVTDKPGCR